MMGDAESVVALAPQRIARYCDQTIGEQNIK